MRGTELHTHISALAASVDRANRPSSLLALPTLLVAAALIVVLWSFSQLRGARAEVALERANLASISRLANEIGAELHSEIDFEALYPRQAHFGSEVIASYQNQGLKFAIPPTIGEPVLATVLSTPVTVMRLDLQCSVTSEPLEVILQWIDTVLRHPTLGGQVWVSSLQLSPSGAGWAASIRFSLYEARK